MLRTVARACAVAAFGVAAGCGDAPHEKPWPSRPATVSLALGSTAVDESANAKIAAHVRLDRYAVGPVAVDLDFGGSATLGVDYAVDRRTVTVPPSGDIATAVIDVYRDFDEESDETIEVGLGTIAGNAREGTPTAATLTIRDGGAAVTEEAGDDGEVPELSLLMFGYTLSEDGVLLVLGALNSSGETSPLVAEWSTDRRFATDVRTLGMAEVEGDGDLFTVFLEPHVFVVPTADLAPRQAYYVRAYLGEEPASTAFGSEAANVFFDGFATDAAGRVAVRCEAPSPTATDGADPLFDEQWHLVNTGQAAFADRGGMPGADLRMSGAIAAEVSGAGVKLAVVDSGLETCHPDLAANAAGKGSYNFAYERLAPFGAVADEPFNFGLLGDHGTSVAGIAAMVADNGVGGRGVAPDVALVGFNPSEALDLEGEGEFGGGFETAMLMSLGGSDAAPDSASVDVFNMSFGIEAPGENSGEEFVRLFKTGTKALRSGRGAVYVKAAGNEFALCGRTHPLNRETGCIASNADPDQNLPWLVVAGGFNADDVKSSYSNAGANLWVVGPSGEDGVASPAMVTADQAGAHGGYSEYPRNRLASAHPLNTDGDYVSAFGGTSSASPAVAGAVAVLLGVNPALTWRDVKHILASTARRIDPHIAEVRAAFDGTPYVAQHAWRTNGAGYGFHNFYGFGAVDVDAAVAMAGGHVPDSLGEFVESAWFDSGVTAQAALAIPDADGAGASVEVAVAGVAGSIEAVVLDISASHTNLSELGVTLRSPAGTASVVNPPFNAALDGMRELRGWHLLSNAFYRESPQGAWTVHVADTAPGGTGSVAGVRLRFYFGGEDVD